MKNKKMLKKALTIFSVVAIVFAMAVPAFATSADVGAEAVSAVSAGLAEVTGTLTVGNVLSVIGTVLGICVGLMFFWWGIRKVIRMVMTAFRKGKVSV